MCGRGRVRRWRRGDSAQRRRRRVATRRGVGSREVGAATTAGRGGGAASVTLRHSPLLACRVGNSAAASR